MSRTSVTIKEAHLALIEKAVKHSVLFSNAEEYLDFVLDKLLRSSQSELSESNIKQLEDRLRQLGYL